MRTLALGATLAIGLALAGCGDSEPDHLALRKACAEYTTLISSDIENVVAASKRETDVAVSDMVDALDSLEGNLRAFATAAQAAEGAPGARMVRKLNETADLASENSEAFRDGRFDEADSEGMFKGIGESFTEGVALGGSSCAAAAAI